MVGMGARRQGVIACAMLAAGAGGSPALAEDVPAADGLFDRAELTGDWGGARSWLEDRGITLTLTQTSDVLGNTIGGFRRGVAYDGVFEGQIDVDLEKLVGWTGGAVHAGAYAIQGHGLSQYYLGNLLTVTSVEAPAQTRLGELWLQQSLFGDVLAVKVGQILADQNFVISDTAGVFVNSTFGFPGSFAVDLPGGGPAYPKAVPGAQVIVRPDEVWTLQAAVFNGDPTGFGSNANGLAFPLGDGVFAIAEVAYAFAPAKDSGWLPGTYKLGGWYNSQSFDNLSVAGNGVSLASPLASGSAQQESGDYALYGVIDQTLWREPGTDSQGFAGFVRATVNPQFNRNEINWYFDLGLAYTGPLPGRDSDIAAIGFAYANISPSLASLARETNTFNGSSEPVPDFEAVLEVTYQAAVTPWLSMQPFFQYIIHPGGNVSEPDNTDKAIGNAAVFGLRAAVTF